MSKSAEKAVNTFLGVSSNFTFYNATHRPQYASLVRAGPTFVELSSTDEQISHEMEQSCSNERVQVLVMVNLMQLPLDIYHTKKSSIVRAHDANASSSWSSKERSEIHEIFYCHCAYWIMNEINVRKKYKRKRTVNACESYTCKLTHIWLAMRSFFFGTPIFIFHIAAFLAN